MSRVERPSLPQVYLVTIKRKGVGEGKEGGREREEERTEQERKEERKEGKKPGNGEETKN